MRFNGVKMFLISSFELTARKWIDGFKLKTFIYFFLLIYVFESRSSEQFYQQLTHH